MLASKAQQKAVNKYVKANYDLYQVKMPKGRKDEIKAHATAHGESVNGFIGRAISETMERDGGGTASEIAQQAAETTQGVGVVSFSDTLEVAQRAAEATGEALPVFITRAVSETAERDRLSQDS